MSVKPGVSHSCEEQRLKVFENRTLRKMSRSKGVLEVTWEWRKLCNEELHTWYYSLVVVSRGLGGR